MIFTISLYYGTNKYDKPVAQALDSSGLYVTGTMHMIPGLNLGDGGRIYTYKYGDDGFWHNIKGTGSEDYAAFAMALDNDGNVIVAGVNRGTDEYIVIKYDHHCNTLWEKTYDAGPGTNPVAVTVDSANNIYVFGRAMDGIQGRYCTLKYDPNGTLQWHDHHDPGAVSLVTPMDMKVDAAGNVYATGYADSARSGAEYYTIKYNTRMAPCNGRPAMPGPARRLIMPTDWGWTDLPMSMSPEPGGIINQVPVP
jgi:hypothetical protein